MTTLILLVSAGFTAALVLVYWGGMLKRWLRPPASVQVHFSPKGGCGRAIIEVLESARSEILMMAYSFTYDPIVKALMEAHARGVNVEMMFDRANEAELRSDMPRCMENGMKVLIDAEHAIAHNKLMIVDQKIVITGSYNFTRQAEDSNAENVVIIRNNKAIVDKYLQYFENHRVHCRKPQLKEGAGSLDKGREMKKAA